MMKRIVATLFFLSILIVAGALIAPSFINWNQHKSQIVKRLQPYIQRKIDVAGDVSFRLLPNPQILLNDVTIESGKAGGRPLMKLKRLEARMKLEPLLEGRFEVDTVNLVQPELNLEVQKNGAANWGGVFKTPHASHNGENRLAEAADAVQLNQVTVSSGTLHYANDNTGLDWQVSNVNLVVAADTLFGPYRVAGTMQYKNFEVNVDMGTGKYEAGNPVPVHANFIPVEGLPQMKLNGVIDVSSGFDMQGDLEVEKGSLGSLFASKFFNSLAFMDDTADLTATLAFKGSALQLNDIKAKFGTVKDGKAAGGEITGSLSAHMSQDAAPEVTAELEGRYIRLAVKNVFLPAPDKFNAHLKLSGKHVVWDGVDIPSVTISADSDKKEWTIKEARFNMPGHSVAKLAGVVTPKNNYAAYSVQLKTDDFPRFVQSLSPSSGNILSAFSTMPLVTKLNFNSSMDLKADKISLFDINAVTGGNTKISGVLNVSRATGKPRFQAHLNLSNVNLDSLPQGVRHDTVKALMKSESALDLNVSNLTDNDLKISTLTFKGKTDEQGLQISALDAKLADGGEVHVDGQMTAGHPHLNYAVQTNHMASVLHAVGMDMPPLLPQSTMLDVKGTLNENNGEPSFTLVGKSGSGDVKMEGSIHRTEGQDDVYESTVHLTNAGADAWSSLGLPIDKLIGHAGAFNFDGKVFGSTTSYKVSELQAKQANDIVTGSFSVDKGKREGKLAAHTIDIDHWLSDEWQVKVPMDLQFTGKKLVLLGQDINQAQLDIHADEKGIKATDLKGTLWQGALSATVSAEKQPEGWKKSAQGDLKDADIQQLAAHFGINKGATFAQGDISFDLSSSQAALLQDMTGKLTVSCNRLTLKDFNLSALPALIKSLATPPEFLSDMVRKSIHTNGDTAYTDVTAKLDVSNKKITIKNLSLANDDATLNVTGNYNAANQRYELKAQTQLAQPKSMPVFRISRSGLMGASADNIVSIKPIVDYIAKHAPKEAPEMEASKTPTAVERHAASEKQQVMGKPDEPAIPAGSAPIESEPLAPPAPPPPQDNAGKDGIKGILDRLDETP